MGIAQTHALSLAAELGVVDLLKNGAKDVSSLAHESGTRPEIMARLINCLVQMGILERAEAGRYRTTPLGDQLRVDAPSGLRNFAMLMGADYFARVWPRLSRTARSGVDPFKEEWGTSYYEYLPQHPEQAGVFMQAMVELSVTQGLAMHEVYDFTPYRKIVDVGGGVGGFLATILPHLPDARGVLFDLPPMIDQAQGILDEVVRQRCDLVPGDFLEGVPAGGDLYVIKSVLMDRPDDEAITILSNIRAAVAPGGKLLVADPDLEAVAGTLVDMLMLLIGGGRLRTDEEMRAVFDKAGFTLSASMSTESTVRIWEGTPTG